MSNETKPSYAERLAAVNARREKMGDPPLNPPKEEITGCMFFPKHDPALLEKYIKENGCKF